MITAVDTSVLVDIFTDDPAFRVGSLAAVRASLSRGSIVACDIVWAEVVAAFADGASASSALAAIPVEFSEIDVRSAATAGAAWRAYRARGGSRERIISDFVIGAHALTRADRLLTRDRGFHRMAFKNLKILDPMGPAAG
jgi:predicted nucleic acid-binding protein